MTPVVEPVPSARLKSFLMGGPVGLVDRRYPINYGCYWRGLWLQGRPSRRARGTYATALWPRRMAVSPGREWVGRWSGIGGLVNDSPRRQRRSPVSAGYFATASGCGVAPPRASEEDILGRNHAGRVNRLQRFARRSLLLSQVLSPRRQSARVFGSKRLALSTAVRDP